MVFPMKPCSSTPLHTTRRPVWTWTIRPSWRPWKGGSNRPGPDLVLIDTVGAATGRDLCRAEQAREFFGPTDGSGGEGIGAATGADPPVRQRGSPRASNRGCGPLPVEADHARPRRPARPPPAYGWTRAMPQKPPALGMTIRADGCDFDHNPPAPAAPSRGGRPPEARQEAEAFIREKLLPATIKRRWIWSMNGWKRGMARGRSSMP